MTEPLVYSVPEVVARLKPIGRDAVYELVRSGRLRSIKVRGRRYVPAAELEAFIAREAE